MPMRSLGQRLITPRFSGRFPGTSTCRTGPISLTNTVYARLDSTTIALTAITVGAVASTFQLHQAAHVEDGDGSSSPGATPPVSTSPMASCTTSRCPWWMLCRKPEPSRARHRARYLRIWSPVCPASVTARSGPCCDHRVPESDIDASSCPFSFRSPDRIRSTGIRRCPPTSPWTAVLSGSRMSPRTCGCIRFKDAASGTLVFITPHQLVASGRHR